MIRMLFKSFFKKFFGLFISMSFVSMLAIGLFVAFGSIVINLDERYNVYLNEYGYVDEQINTGLVKRSELKQIQTDVEGLDKVDIRFTLDTYLKKSRAKEDPTLTSRIFSYNENENELFKRYVVSHIEPNYEKVGDTFKYVNAGITSKFAKNNNIKIGDTLVIGYLDAYVDIYINEIVETPEGIYPRANEYIWSDNQGFGYMYVGEVELGKGITNLANAVIKKIGEGSTPEEQEQIRQLFVGIIELLGLPDFLDPNIDPNYPSLYGNQVLVKNKAGYSQKDTLTRVLDYYASKNIKVTKSLEGDMLPYRIYMNNAKRQLNIASIFLPVFFYSVTMIIIGLFMNQIIKNMTSDIGVMMSIGVGHWDIVSLFIVFALLVGITSGLFGAFVGYGINVLMTNIMINTYSIPILTNTIHPLITIGAIVALVVFAEVATLLSCLAIFKITPKDAVISNESKRKQNPKWVNTLIDKAPMNIKLGLNSIFQNPKRFFVSTFSIFASFVLIMLCCNFYVSKNEMMDQSFVRRLNYDCQVYMLGVSEQAQKDEIQNLECVTAFEDCYYTYLKATGSASNSIYIETLAYDENSTQNLVIIPDSNGQGNIKIKSQGIILPKTDAERLGVGVGDNITIGNYQLQVTDISYQYFHPISYLSKTEMEAIKNSDSSVAYVSSFLVNITDKAAFSAYFIDNSVQCLTIYTSNLSKDLHSIFDSIEIMIFIMIGFAFGIGFVILTIMSQNSLMEQKRSLSVLRLIGFTVGDVSRFWSLQSILQILSSLVISIPAGVGASIALFTAASSSSQVYPFIFSWPVVFISLGFIIATVLICHSTAMLTVRKWNLADNTRSRE